MPPNPGLKKEWKDCNFVAVSLKSCCMPEPRPMAEVRRILVERARERRTPFFQAVLEAVTAALDQLESVEPRQWVAT
jgi:hypothetical protein